MAQDILFCAVQTVLFVLICIVQGGYQLMMKAYVGKTEDPRMVSDLKKAEIGEVLQRGELLGSCFGRRRSKPGPIRTPWFYDNGAFRDWTKEEEFNYLQWSIDIRNISRFTKPDFIVVPDLVAQGVASLEFSLDHLTEIRQAGRYDAYLVVQDGMSVKDVNPVLKNFDGIFVGGTSEWKWETARQWVALAHIRNKPCHIGRAGTLSQVQKAKDAGADSIDSCFPLWKRTRLASFIEAVKDVVSCV